MICACARARTIEEETTGEGLLALMAEDHVRPQRRRARGRRDGDLRDVADAEGAAITGADG
jgi:hypothetical protein